MPECYLMNTDHERKYQRVFDQPQARHMGILQRKGGELPWFFYNNF